MIMKEENQSKFREQKDFAVCQMISVKRTVQSEQNGSQTVFPLTKLVQMIEDNTNEILPIRKKCLW